MSTTVTPQSIINLARQRVDKVASTFVDDATELMAWASESMRELFDIMVGAYGEEYFQNHLDLSVAADSEYTTLSAALTEEGTELYKLLRVDFAYNSVRVPLRPFQWSDEVLDDDSYQWDPSVGVRYRLAGLRMYFTPRPDTAQTVRLYYIPEPEIFCTLTQPIDRRFVHHLQYIVNDLSMKIRDKEESDISSFLTHKQLLIDRVRNMAPPRDAGNPQPIPDVRTDTDDYYWLRGSD